jgi:hypothetical protein
VQKERPVSQENAKLLLFNHPHLGALQILLDVVKFLGHVVMEEYVRWGSVGTKKCVK